MDFLSISDSEQELEILDTAGHAVGLFFVLHPKSANEVQAVIRKHKRESFEAVRKNKDLAAMQERHRPELMAAFVKSHRWASETQFNGKPITPVDLNPETLKGCFRNPKFDWMTDQIERAIGDLSAFFPN